MHRFSHVHVDWAKRLFLHRHCPLEVCLSLDGAVQRLIQQSELAERRPVPVMVLTKPCSGHTAILLGDRQGLGILAGQVKRFAALIQNVKFGIRLRMRWPCGEQNSGESQHCHADNAVDSASDTDPNHCPAPSVDHACPAFRRSLR